MPKIGRPTPNQPNKLKSAKIAQVAKLNTGSTKNLRDQLNDAAGVARQSEFVDKDAHNQMDKDAFMKLLTFQLANQDPLNPVDQKKFSAELAQFAQLEQSAKMNKNMEKLASNQTTEKKFMAASFLGKEIQTYGTSLNYDGESMNTNVPFFLPKDAETVFVRIYDQSGNMLAQVEQKKMNKGTNSIVWDGNATDGRVAPPGEYRYDVIAFDRDLEQFRGETRAKGLVTGVHFEKGEAILTVDKTRKVFLRDVISFGLPEGKIKHHVQPEKNIEMAKKAYEQQQDLQ